MSAQAEGSVRWPVGVPVDAGAGMAFSRAWRGALHPRGRASRSEYWWFQAFLALATAIALGIDVALKSRGLVTLLVLLVTLAPWVSVCLRRLHDAGYSGAFFLVQYLPFVGPFWLLVLLVQPSQRLTNSYGPGPGDRPAT